jgi:hypothetical protein
MISSETRAQIRRYFYVEHWKVGTIASELGVHPDTVHNAIESELFRGLGRCVHPLSIPTPILSAKPWNNIRGCVRLAFTRWLATSALARN